MAAKEKLILGWREWISLPDFGIEAMKAKIDTGARTSAIHAFDVREFERDGATWLSFYIHPIQRQRYPEIGCEALLADRRKVRSSNGREEMRYVISTTLRIGPREWPAEFTLTSRDEMGFRALIGRQALRPRCLVDPAKSFAASAKKTRQPKGDS